MPTQTEIQGALRECLARMDVGFAHKYWSEMFPGQKSPKNYAETRICLHIARTACESSRLSDRLWSHQWLTERQFPSKLPNELRPDFGGSVIVSAVGLVVDTNKSDRASQERVIAIRTAMENAINEMYSHGIEDPVQVSKYMWECARKVKEW